MPMVLGYSPRLLCPPQHCVIPLSTTFEGVKRLLQRLTTRLLVIVCGTPQSPNDGPPLTEWLISQELYRDKNPKVAGDSKVHRYELEHIDPITNGL